MTREKNGELGAKECLEYPCLRVQVARPRDGDADREQRKNGTSRAYPAKDSVR